MEESPRGLRRFSVQGLVDSVSALVVRALEMVNDFRHRNDPQIETPRAEVVEDIDLVLEDEDIFRDREPNPPSAKRLAVKAAQRRRVQERAQKRSTWMQAEMVGFKHTRKRRRNQGISTVRKFRKEIGSRGNN
jgi:hypothetical protein